MTSAELIRFFENRITEREQKGFASGTGNRPYAPVLVAYLGEAARRHAALKQAVFRLWPQFCDEICFLALGGVENKYSRPAEGDEGNIELAAGQVSGAITALFGAETHFEDPGCLNVWFVMQTDDFSHVADYDRWVDRIRQFRRKLCDIEAHAVLVVLLNEDFVGHHRSVAQEIRKRLGAYAAGDSSLLPVNSVYLLSNRRSDNVILGSWDDCSHIIASIMAASNSRDIRVGQGGKRRVYTVGYTREEKPLHSIGQVVVHRVIDALTDMMGADEPRMDSGVVSKLGITEQGTLRLLDDAADMIDLPGLEIFPRRDKSNRDVYALSGDSFDALTMGSWRAYLEALLENALQRARGDADTLRRRFEKALESAFGVGELLSLYRRETSIRELLRPRKPSQSENVLSDARAYLRYRFSSDEALVAPFWQAIRYLGVEAEQAAAFWSELVESKQSDYTDVDDSVTEFYSHVCRQYFNRHSDSLREKAREAHTCSELRKLARDVICGVIESDGVFSAGYEEELKARMKYIDREPGVWSYIQSRLTGESVKVYLRPASALDAPQHSILLMNTETALKQALEQTLADGGSQYDYYNTGSGATAEALEIYAVSAAQLV